MATIEDFQKLDIRVGIIKTVDDFPESKKPSYKLTIDFGDEVGKKSSVQIVSNYQKSELLGKQVLGIVKNSGINSGACSEFLSTSKIKFAYSQTKVRSLRKLNFLSVNFPPRKIGPFISEVLTLGVPDERGNCVLVVPTKLAKKGGKLY